MSWPYAATFLILAGACAVTAAGLPLPGTILFGYAAGSFLLVAVAYAGLGSGLFLKRRDGRLRLASWLLFLPYHLLNRLSLALARWTSREPAFAEVRERLWIGRRLTTSEAQAGKWLAVLDLAGEFGEVAALRTLPGYRSLPILDATAPTPEQLTDAVAWLRTALATGPVYVHCALGHGRTGTVVAAYLVSEGATVAEALALLRAARPGVRLNRTQLRALRAWAGRGCAATSAGR